jgi:hypothetical protein
MKSIVRSILVVAVVPLLSGPFLTACSSESTAWDCSIGSRYSPPESLSVPPGCTVEWDEEAGVWCSYC